MLDKKEDTFFDEKTAEDDASANLLKMIDDKKEVISDNFTAGMQVKGKVSRIGSEYVFVDIRGKNEALISLAEVTNKDGSLRRVPGAVCWHGHRDFMRALFRLAPESMRGCQFG